MNEADVIIEKLIKHINYKITRSGIKIRELAKITNIPKSTLQDNLSGKSAMALSTAIKLVRYFEIDMNHLILNDKHSQKIFLLTDHMDDTEKEFMYLVVKSFADYNDKKALADNKKQPK